MNTYCCFCSLIIDEELAKKIVEAGETASGNLPALDTVEMILDSMNAGLCEHLEEYDHTGDNEDCDITDGCNFFSGKSAGDSGIVGANAIILHPYNDAELFKAAYASPEDLVEEYRQRVEKLGVSLTMNEIKDRVYNLDIEAW